MWLKANAGATEWSRLDSIPFQLAILRGGAPTRAGAPGRGKRAQDRSSDGGSPPSVPNMVEEEG